MKKLFKEIWKSLSKTKSLIIGLTVLTFLSSGVFTLLNDVKTNYTNQFDDYKKISKIHDLTVDTDIIAAGDKPNQPYISKTGAEKTVYYTNNTVKPNKAIRISKADLEKDKITGESFLKLSKIFSNAQPEEANFYIKAQDFYRFIQLNNITNFVGLDGTVDVKNYPITPFKKYLSPGVAIPTSYTLKTTDKITKFHSSTGANITFGEIMLVVPGKDSFFSSTDDRITNVRAIYVNGQTHEATVSQSLKQSWEKQGTLITINPSQVAKLLGFKHDGEGIYSIDNTLKQNGVFNLIRPTGTQKWRLNKSLNLPMIAAGFSINFNQTILNDIVLNSIDEFYLLNKTFVIPKEWIVNEKISYEFERYHTEINYDFANSLAEQNKLWTQNYKTYLESLNAKEKTYFQQTSYWKKTQIIEIVGKDGVTVLDPSETIKMSQKISSQDFNRELKLKRMVKINGTRAPNDERTLVNNSILWIERESNFISQTDIDIILQNPNSETALNVLKIINNSNSKNERIKQIDDGAKAIAKESLYKVILDLVESIENIGLRENITISGFEQGKPNIFHFINGGNQNQEVQLNDDIYVKQNVGKLYNEANEKSLLFELTSKDDIKSPKVSQAYIFKILEIIFNGMAVDKNYINPIITFENYEYIPYDNAIKQNSTALKKMNNAKIIRMQDGVGTIFGVTKQAPRVGEKEGKFYILKETLKEGKKVWVSELPIGFDGSYDHMKSFINDNDLNFADTTSTGKKVQIVGPNGWAKQNANYTNKYSIPFKIAIPRSGIIDNWQESNNFNVFRDNLISSLTELLSPLISPQNLKIVIESLTTSFTKNGFADVLVFPSKIENRKLQKILFGIFYEGAKYDDKLFWNSFLDEILQKIIDNPNPDYINKQLELISPLFKMVLGIDFNISNLLPYFKSTKEVIIGFRKIIASINIDQTIIQIWDNFYDLERPKYEVIGSGDILPILIGNIGLDNPVDPSIGFKAGLKQIVSQVNFGKVIGYIKSSVLDKESLELFGPILDQLNNVELGADYQNVNLGLNKIIDLINLSEFGNNIKQNSSKREYFIDEEKGPQKYIVNSISVSGILASLLDSLGANNDNDDALHNALIEMLNISSKTQFVGIGSIGLYQPESDPNKLDIRDFQSLLKSPTPKLDNLVESLEKLSVSLKDPNFFLDPNSTVGQYLTNYIFNFAEDTSIKNVEIKKRVDIYLEFMKQTKFVNFDPNMQVGTSDILGGNITNPTQPDSLADKFINMINPNVSMSNGVIHDTVSKEVYKEFYNKNNLLQSRDMTSEILNFYAFWMKFSEISLNNPNTTTLDVQKQIVELVNRVLDKNSEVGKILNSATKSFVGPPLSFMNFKILDGFSNAKGTANKLLQTHPETWLSGELLDYYFDYFNGNLVINNNTISLVSALTSIISVDNPKDLRRADLITNDFVKLFLPQDKEKANIMLTLGQRTLNTLSGSANSIMEGLGLSSAIMSPFTGVLNAPVILWFTVNQDATGLTSPGNLQFIVKNKLYKFNSNEHNVGIDYGGFKDIVDSLLGEETYIDDPQNMDEMITFSLDLDYLDYLTNDLLVDKDTGINIEIFGVNLADVLNGAIDSFAEVSIDDFKIVISDIGSYLAKVNDAYLRANKKEVYNLDKNNAPKNSNEMQDLLASLPDKNKLNVNGLEFLIIGSDSTVDYLYPVTGLNNIQVDTKTQALVYVNQSGFDRVVESNANAVIEKYFLLIAPKGKTPAKLQEEINKYIYESTTGLNNYNDLTNNEKNNSNYKKAFLYNETNPLKPEISLRLQTIEELISIINETNILISIVLVFLIGVVTIFVIKRYVSSRSRVLGILKAQGYKSIQIALSICLFALIVVFFGSSLGYIVGHFLQIPFMDIFSIYWTLPIGSSSFDVISLIVTVLIPLFGLILLTIITTLFLLRIKPTQLMDGSFQLNNSKGAEIITKKFHNRNVMSKFTLSLSLNSIWKLIALFVSLLLTVTIISFSIASNNAFGNAINKTYKNRKYNFKIDLLTPTLEGGAISTLDKQDVNNLLYVPIGNPNEGQTYLADYFKPGANGVINPSSLTMPNYYPNGQPTKYDKHIITKSSLDLMVNSGGIQVNVWNTLFNSMPDSQKSSAIEISQYAAKWLEWSQELTNYGQSNEYKSSGLPGDETKLPYFKYIINLEKPEKSQFIYRNVNPTTNEYFHQNIIIEGQPENVNDTSIRDKYREFLVKAYNESLINKNLPQNEDSPEVPKLILDYFISFGSVMFNDETDEKYSYALTNSKTNTRFMPTINGYNVNSKQVQILDSHQNNLLAKAEEKWNSSKSIVPIVINHVVKDKYKLGVGSKLELTVLNTSDRFIDSIKEQLKIGNASQKTWSFEVIGINETFINEEWSTTQEIINEITNLNNPLLIESNETPFNGILTTSENPVQATESLGLYSENGYWAADEKMNLNSTNISNEQQAKNINIFKELFYKMKQSNNSDILTNQSVFATTLKIINPNFSTNETESLIKQFLNIDQSLSLAQIIEPGHESIVNASLETFSKLYNSNNILIPSFKDIKSKNIESGFIWNTTHSINSISTIVLILSLLISITILIMISTLIIGENERNVAIFSILGYNNKEKIILFFSLYIPIIILAILLSIPLTLGLISLFTSVANSSILISLSISLGVVNIVSSSAIVLAIFGLTTLIAWFNLNRIKPIILLKGD